MSSVSPNHKIDNEIKDFDLNLSQCVESWELEHLPVISPKAYGNTNTVFCCKRNSQTVFLRYTSVQHRSKNEVLAEVDWMASLARYGVSVVAPIPTKNGSFTVDIQKSDVLLGVTILMSSAPGRSTNRNIDFNSSIIIAWAHLIAKLHIHSTFHYKPQQVNGRHVWTDDHVLRIALADNATETSFARMILNKRIDDMKKIVKTHRNFGLTHADLQMTNFNVLYPSHDNSVTSSNATTDTSITVDNGSLVSSLLNSSYSTTAPVSFEIQQSSSSNVTITAFDFDDCCYHYYIHDLAVVVCQLYKTSLESPNTFQLKHLKELFLNSYFQFRSDILVNNSLSSNYQSLQSVNIFLNDEDAFKNEVYQYLSIFVSYRASLIVCWASRLQSLGQFKSGETWFKKSLPFYLTLLQQLDDLNENLNTS